MNGIIPPVTMSCSSFTGTAPPLPWRTRAARFASRDDSSFPPTS
jgi:hypothetical protein